MTFELQRGAARAKRTAALLGILGAGALAGACGGGGDTGGQGGSASTSTSSSSSSSSSTGAGGATSSSSGMGGGGGGSSAHLAEWVRSFIGSQQRPSSVATDAQGNIYVGGSFEAGAVDFGKGQHDCPMGVGVKNWCGFLLKLDPSGKTLWSRAFVADDTISIDVPALGASDTGVFIAAHWQRYQLKHAPLDIGTGPLDPVGDYPMVLAKFGTDGTPLWSAAYGVDSGEVVPASLIVDGSDSFLVGGSFSTATLDLGDGPMPLAGDRSIFVSRFNGGKAAWQKSFGGMTSQGLAGLGRDKKGNLEIAGYFQDSIELDAGMLASKGTWSVFQATLDPTGTFVSGQSYDSTGMYPGATGAAADTTGGTLVTGTFDGGLTFGANALTCQGDVNGYIAKVDAGGKVVFAQASAEPMMSADSSFCVAADASNNVLWGADMTFADMNGTHYMGRISKLDPTGALLWTVAGMNFGARAFAFDDKSNVITAGEFSTEIDFAKGGPVKATVGINAFIAKFAP